MTAAELRARLTAIAAEPLPGEVAHGDDVLEILDRAAGAGRGAGADHPGTDARASC